MSRLDVRWLGGYLYDGDGNVKGTFRVRILGED